MGFQGSDYHILAKLFKWREKRKRHGRVCGCWSLGVKLEKSILKTCQQGSYSGKPRTKLVTMARRTRENQVQLLDDKINILERNEAEASPGAEQVLKTVGGIQALVRVSATVPRLALNSLIISDLTRTR